MRQNYVDKGSQFWYVCVSAMFIKSIMFIPILHLRYLKWCNGDVSAVIKAIFIDLAALAYL